MGRAVSFIQTGGAGTQTWTVDEDCAVVGFTSWVQSAVTRDLTANNATYFTPGASKIDVSLIAHSGAAAASSSKMIILPRIPLYKGEVILVTFAATGVSQLFLDDLI
jgi:hypothetical protein